LDYLKQVGTFFIHIGRHVKNFIAVETLLEKGYFSKRIGEKLKGREA
jgi:hypothetical protein